MAQREGFDAVFYEPEINVSGAKADRAVVEQIIACVEAGDLDGLVVYKLDRLSRLAPRQRAELFERIEAAGGAVLSATEDLDASTPQGRFVRELWLGLARMQWEEHRDAFAARAAEAVAAGVHAHPPFGYRKDGRRRKLVRVQREALVVEGLFDRRAGGVSWAQLARWADTTAVRPRRAQRWTRRAVENIVCNRAYLGEARYGTHVQPGAHPPIVTVEQFEAANGARGVRPPRGQAALLSGLVRCAGCRHRMSASVVGQRKQLVYRCKARHGAGSCEHPASVSRELLEQLVQAAFLARYGDVEVVAADTTLTDATDALRAAERERAAYIETISVQDVGADAFKAGAVARTAAVEDARAALHRARSEAGGLDLGPDGVEIWPDLGIAEKRRLLAAGLDCLFVRRAPAPGRNGGPVADRVRVFWRGEQPDGLPGPGVRVQLAGLDW